MQSLKNMVSKIRKELNNIEHIINKYPNALHCIFIPIEELSLNQNSYSRLQNKGVKTIGDLLEYRPTGLGKKTLADINKHLKKYGLCIV